MYFSARAVEDIIKFAEADGAQTTNVYAAIGYTPSALQAVEFVDYATVAAALCTAVELTGDDYFGLHMGSQPKLAATRELDGIMQTSFNLEETLRNASRFSKLISDASHSEFHIARDTFRYEFHLNPDWLLQRDMAVRQAIDIALARVKSLVQQLSGGLCRPCAISLHYARPMRIEEYYRVFNAPIRFHQEYSSIVFPREHMTTKNPAYNNDILASIKRYAQDKLKKLETESPYITKVKKHLYRRLSPDFPTLEQVADALGVSKRTLQRNLMREGASYNAILTDIRMKAAVKYLQEYGISVSEAAYLLGYAEPAAFSRAFSKTYGVSPIKYRHHLRAVVPDAAIPSNRDATG